jgi:hypothetical protein
MSAELPEELKTNYIKQAHKTSHAIERLKIMAALKLWNDRNYHDIQFDVPITRNGKTVFAKVLTKNAEGLVIAIECTSVLRSKRLRARIELLRNCLPNSYIIAVFPSTAGEKVEKVIGLTDELWVTGKNGKVEQMMFMSAFHRG